MRYSRFSKYRLSQIVLYDPIRSSDWVIRLTKLQLVQVLMFGIYEETNPDYLGTLDSLRSVSVGR